HVEQLTCSSTAKVEAPTCDDHAAHDTHHRVKKSPAHIATAERRADRKETGKRVRQHMHVSRAEVMVSVIVRAMAVGGVVVVVLIVTFAVIFVIVSDMEKLQTSQVDKQPDNRDG